MSDFFLSYSRQDQTWVQCLADALKEQGREALVDAEDILPSEEWRGRLEQMIRESHGFVFVLSDTSIESAECAKELAAAISLGKRLLPLHYKLSTRDYVAPELGNFQWINASPVRDISAVAAELIQALDTDIERVRFHTRLTLRTADWQNGSSDSLLRGKELTEAEAFIADAGTDPVATTEQRKFVEVSRTAVRDRRQRMVFAVTGALVVIAVVGLIAQYQWRASNCNDLLGEVDELLEEDPATARTRILDATLYCTSAQQVRLDGFVARMLTSPRPTARIGPVRGRSVVFSEDGAYLATGPNRSSLLFGSESGLEIWRHSDSELIATLEDWSLPPATLSVTSESLIVVDTTGRLVFLNREDNRVLGEIELSPQFRKKLIQGRFINIASADHRPVKVVRISEPKGTRIEFDLHAGMNGPKVLDPRMEFLAEANGGTIRIVRQGQLVKKLEVTAQGGLYAIASIAISPNGDFVAAGTEVGVEFWNRDGHRVELFRDPDAKMQSLTLAFDPTGRRLVTTQAKALHASVWDLADIRAASPSYATAPISSRRPVLVLRGTTPLSDARFGPDPTMIATRQDDGHVMIWETGLSAARFDFVPRRSMVPLVSPSGWHLSRTDDGWHLKSQIDPDESIILKESREISDLYGRIILRGQFDGGIATLHLRTEAGELQLLQLTENQRFIDFLGFSESGHYFAVGSIRGSDRRIIVYRCSACGLDPAMSLNRLRVEHARVSG